MHRLDALPSPTLAKIHLRAMRTLVADLKKRKLAVLARDVASSTAAESADATVPVRSDLSVALPRQRGRTVSAAFELEKRNVAVAARSVASPAGRGIG